MVAGPRSLIAVDLRARRDARCLLIGETGPSLGGLPSAPALRRSSTCLFRAQIL